MNKLCYLLVTCILCISSFTANAKKITINTAHSMMPMTSSTQATPGKDGILDKLIMTMFEDIGLQAELYGRHAERALRFANTGIVDGDAGRIIDLDKKYRNLIRVEEVLLTIDITGFTAGQEYSLNGWKSLEGRNVGIPTGWKILERNVPHALRFTDITSLFEALKEGTIEIAALESSAGQYTGQQLEIKNLQTLEPVLLRLDMFLYMHKKHHLMIPDLQKALKKMKQDGRYIEMTKLPD